MLELRQWWRSATPRALVALVMSFTLIAPSQMMAASDNDHGKNQNETETPIKHVIVLIGENRTFDHIFATYVPKSKDSVSNLLSKGIIKPMERPALISQKPRNPRQSLPFQTKFFVSLE